MSQRIIKSLPVETNGAAPRSSATAWVFGSAVTLNASLSTDIHVIGLQFQNTDTPALDTTQEILFEITVGGTTKLQIPFSIRADSLVGYHDTSSAYTFYLPEAYTIPKGSAVAVQVTDSIAAALTYGGVKLLYMQPSFYDDARPAIRDGLVSAQSEATGWNATVKPNIPLDNIVRTSDNVVTVTLQAQADHNITAQETITDTIPAIAVLDGSAIVATPTFTVDPGGAAGIVGKSYIKSQAVNRAASW